MDNDVKVNKTQTISETSEFAVELRKIHAFFISYTFISNARLKIAINQAYAKQHPEAEHLLFENYCYFSSTLPTKSNRAYSRNKQKNKCACIQGIIRLILKKMKTKMETRSHIYDINRPKPRYSKYKMCLNMMLLNILSNT